MKPVLWEFNPLYTLTTSVRSVHFNTEVATPHSVYRPVSGRTTILLFLPRVESCSLAYRAQFSSLALHACCPVGTELLTGRNVELTICLCVVRKWWMFVYLAPLFPRKPSQFNALLGAWKLFMTGCFIWERRKHFYPELLILFLISWSIMSDNILLIRLHM